jgi:LysR family hca operon transcriptional activator
MELRHLRYFVAVADAGSLTVAAGRKLHTSQPSLSRQIRDLEDEVGAQLLTRGARGIELTPAGRAFLDHARLVLSQVEAAADAARGIAHPARPRFVMGFLTNHELTWMPEAFRILGEELPNIDVMISSQYSPSLANALLKGTVDAAFLRRERGFPELAFRLLVKEPLLVFLPSGHRLAALKAISPADLVGEKFVSVSHTAAPVLRRVIDNYLKRSGVHVTPAHEIDHAVIGTKRSDFRQSAVALIASTRGVGLLPAYTQNFLSPSVTSRPLKGETPTVDLVLGYKKSNKSPILKLLLSRLDELIARASSKAQDVYEGRILPVENNDINLIAEHVVAIDNVRGFGLIAARQVGLQQHAPDMLARVALCSGMTKTLPRRFQTLLNVVMQAGQKLT